MRYLDPKNDLTFKKVFGEHPRLLKSFLNAMLPLDEGGEIESLEYLPAEMVPEIPLMKNTIVDVRCKDKKGRQFIVEMQMIWTDTFMQRVLFNASKAYVKQLEKNQQYALLQPVYALSLIDDTFDKSQDYYHHYKIVNTQNPERQIEGLEFVFVELPKFKPENMSQKKLQVLWLRFLTEIDEKSIVIPAELLNQAEIRDAIEVLQESAFSLEELELYDRYWDMVRVERTLVEDAELRGMKVGLKEGLKEGLEQGAKLSGLKTALNGFKKDMTDAVIAELTGLSFETIRRLKELLNKYGPDTEAHFDEL